MEVERSEGEENDIFAGIEAPWEQTESEYELSDIEHNIYQNDHSGPSYSEPYAEASPAPSLIRSHKRKDSPTKSTGSVAKKQKTRGWTLHRQYRDILNADIDEITKRAPIEGYERMYGSQIGSSTWASEEKELFFHYLTKFGRDNVEAISHQIPTKSVLEVQEYVSILHKALIDRRSRGHLLELPDFPAAIEIGEDCCTQIEEVAHTFNAKQDQHESKTERQKWGDSWLVTTEVIHWLDKRRSQSGGTKAIDDVLPAASLFHVNKWLELSRRIFMNPTSPFEEENWHSLAEEYEYPAIRATALEDFHSLVVYTTKKLISTTFYCTTSRERATRSRKIKHADITPADVRAAARILKMPDNSDEYWRKCAKRCHLRVIDDADDPEDAKGLSNAEIETALAADIQRSRSRSRSLSVNHRSTPGPETPNSQDTSPVHSDDEHMSENYEISVHGVHSTTGSPTSSVFSDISDIGSRLKSARDRENRILQLEEYTETLDQEAGLAEELRLWKSITRPAPPDVLNRLESVRQKALTRPNRVSNDFDNRLKWREHVNFKSEWETMVTPVAEATFTNNRSLKRKRKESSEEAATLGLSEEFVDEENKSLSVESQNVADAATAESENDEEDDGHLSANEDNVDNDGEELHTLPGQHDEIDRVTPGYRAEEYEFSRDKEENVEMSLGRGQYGEMGSLMDEDIDEETYKLEHQKQRQRRATSSEASS